MKFRVLVSSVLYIVLVVIIAQVLSALLVRYEFVDRYRTEMLYKEPENSIDVVVVGTSTVLYGWNYLSAWKKYRIITFPVSYTRMGLFSMKYLIREVLKRQKPKVLIVSVDLEAINSFEEDNVRLKSYCQLLYLRPSLNKLLLTHSINKYANKYINKKLSLFEKAEFYFPIIRFHDNWKKFSKIYNDWILERKGKSDIKYDIHREGYLVEGYVGNKLGKDDQENFAVIDILNEDEIFLFRDLFSYLKTLDVPVLLIAMPQRYKFGSTEFKRFSQIDELAKEYNLVFINFASKEDYDKLNLTSYDYYDAYHLNYDGSIKFTDYIVPYLKEKYNLKDEHSKDIEVSWDSSFNYYDQKVQWFLRVARFGI